MVFGSMDKIVKCYSKSLEASAMKDLTHFRVAWLLPSMARGFYLQPVLREFTKIFPEAVVFTGLWPGFARECEGCFKVKVVGKTRFVKIRKTVTGHSTGIVLPPLRIIRHLVEFKPQVIFSSTFTLWTALSLLLKPWKRWRVVVVYSGSSLSVDMRKSRVRLFIRRVMAQQVDAFVTNSQAGRTYLTKVLKVEAGRVFARPYQIPEVEALLGPRQQTEPCSSNIRRPVFLFVGRIIRGKGLHLLLEACSILQTGGYRNHTLFIVGDGSQRGELEDFIKSQGLEARVRWAGWVDYGKLGAYFQDADVFVFPTLEDVWGMVVLEAMIFGKPVLCSKWAGAAEMIVDSKNGHVFDPYRPEKLADLMKRFIDNPSLIRSMGEHSKQIMASYTPELVAKHLAEVVGYVVDRSRNTAIHLDV